MLVLTRQIDEEIIIDGRIVVKVLAIHGNQVRLGIEAPREVEVYRREIYDQIAQATKEATTARPEVLREVLSAREKSREKKSTSEQQEKEAKAEDSGE